MTNGARPPGERSRPPLDAVMIVPQTVLHASRGELRRLRLLALLLLVACLALGAVALKGWQASGRSLRLEHELRNKDAALEQLRQEYQRLEEKLNFNRKVDELVAKIARLAPRLEPQLIRPAAESALVHTSDPALYLAIGLVEAELRADVVHTDGVALGMHGLCPKDWHPYLKAKGIMHKRADYFDPVKSFRGSEAVLSALVREYGSLEKALLFYNGGIPAAAGMIPQSRAYVKRVLRLREFLAAAPTPPQTRPS